MPFEKKPSLCPFCGRVLPSRAARQEHVVGDHKPLISALRRAGISFYDLINFLKDHRDVPEGYTEKKEPYRPWFEEDWARWEKAYPAVEEEARRYWEGGSPPPERPKAKEPRKERRESPPASPYPPVSDLAPVLEELARRFSRLEESLAGMAARVSAPPPSSEGRAAPNASPSPGFTGGSASPSTSTVHSSTQTPPSQEGQAPPEREAPPAPGEEERGEVAVSEDFVPGSFLQYLGEKRIVPFHVVEAAQAEEEAEPRKAEAPAKPSPSFPWMWVAALAGAAALFLLLRKRQSAPAAPASAPTAGPRVEEASPPSAPPPPPQDGSFWDPQSGRFYSRKYPHLRFG